MKRKLKVTMQDGTVQELEVEIPDTMVDTADPAFSEAFIPKAVHNVQMAAARKEGQGPKKEDLLKDDGFKSDALKAWNIDPTKLGGTDQDAVKKAVELATAPLTTENTALKSQLGKLLDTTLDSELERFARESGVKDELMARVTPDGPPLIVGMLRSKFAYHPEHGYHAVKGAKDGEFAYSPKATNERPYLDVAGFFDSWRAQDDVKKNFLKDPRQRVGGPQPNQQQSQQSAQQTQQRQQGAPPMVITREEAASGAHLEGIANGSVVVQ